MTEEIEPRADREFWCVMRERKVLLLDDICFSRARDARCGQCIYDQDGLILSRLVWLLLDMMEDRDFEEHRRTCET